MLYFIDPVDSYFFRSSVPFEAGGETTVVQSMFPPLPSVYAGALKRFEEENSVSKHKFKIQFNGLCLEDDVHFPLPLDLHLLERISDKELFFTWMSIKKQGLSNYPLPYMPFVCGKSKEKPKNPGMPYISMEQMKRYLRATEKTIQGRDLQQGYFVVEPKVGIEKDRQSGTSKDQMLYQVNGIRTIPSSKLKLVVEAQGIQERLDHVVKLGGEGRNARIQSGNSTCTMDMGDPVERQEEKYFKLYFATPALFEFGWLPSWIHAQSKTGRFTFKKKSIRLELLAACSGRQIPCGGFGPCKEAKGARPRQLLHGIPAGSVYYFKILEGGFEDAVKLFHQKCLSEYREGLGFRYTMYDRSRYCDRGFGYALVGRVTKEQEDLFHEQG